NCDINSRVQRGGARMWVEVYMSNAAADADEVRTLTVDIPEERTREKRGTRGVMPTFLASPRLIAYLLLTLSLGLHLRWLAQPPEIVFDEVLFGQFVAGYFTGEYFFDTPPPLGKLLLAGGARLVGGLPTSGFFRIGGRYPDGSYWWL